MRAARELKNARPRTTVAFGLLIAAWLLAPNAAHAQFRADMDPGETLFGECRDCHNFAEGAGPGRKAPNLWGVFGRVAGTAPSYDYTPELKASGIVWTETTMDKWLRGPGNMVLGTRMDFQVPNETQREYVLEYMRNVDIAGYIRAIQGLK